MFLEIIEDYMAMLMHGAVVGLHVVELNHVNGWTIAQSIGVAYLILSSIEFVHLKQKVKAHNLIKKP